MKKNAFTLIELTVVVFIIVLLTAIGFIVFNSNDAKKNQNDTARKKELQDIAVAIEAFKADKGHYPIIEWGGPSATTQHAYQYLHPGSTTTCGPATLSYGTSTTEYIVTNIAKAGTEIVFDENGDPCDDLSLQLLGEAYLPQMPANGGIPPSWQAGGRAYLDHISQDPNYGQTISTATADYAPAGSPKFRYFYNSYFQNCAAEAIFTADHYWLNTYVQLKQNGTLSGDLYFYELGNFNKYRSPVNACS